MRLQDRVKIALRQREKFAGRIQDGVELLDFARQHGEFADRVSTAEVGHDFFFFVGMRRHAYTSGPDQVEAVDGIAFAHQYRALFMADRLELVGELPQHLFAERAEDLVSPQEIEALTADLGINGHTKVLRRRGMTTRY